MVLVCLVDQVLRLDVARKVVRDEVVVAVVNDTIDQRRECIGVAELATTDRVKNTLQGGVELEARIAMCMAEVLHVLGQIAEQEDILLAYLTSDFNLNSSVSVTIDLLIRLTFAPSHVPMMRPPLRTNFMFDVPDLFLSVLILICVGVRLTLQFRQSRCAR